jgi:hypothetical protein
MIMTIPEIGDIVDGHQVTEVRKIRNEGFDLFGVKGNALGF